MRTTVLVAVLLVASVAPAIAEDWVSFSMGEGPDLRLDRSSIRRDTEGAIAPWGKGWMAAKTERNEGGYTSHGYFVTDCRDLYYNLRVDPQTGAIEDQGAQPLKVTPGAVAHQIQTVVCESTK